MMDILASVLLPFQLTFMQQAFVIGVAVAVPTALLSCILVLKGWSLMGDAISHAVLPGIVLSYLAGLPLAVGAFGAGLFCAMATGYLKENSRIKEDTVMGVVFSGMFGLGLVLFVKVQSDVHLDHILFGNILGVTWGDVAQSLVIGLACCGFLLAKRSDLLLSAFDEQQARALGLPVTALHYALLAVLSLTIVGALKAVGIILAIAMLVTPGAIAFLITRRFDSMLLVAVAVAVSASFIGIYLSFFIDSAPAPTIVLTMTVMFVTAFLRQQHRLGKVQSRNAIKPDDKSRLETA
jgi:manganese/iron transport system permease protein